MTFRFSNNKNAQENIFHLKKPFSISDRNWIEAKINQLIAMCVFISNNVIKINVLQKILLLVLIITFFLACKSTKSIQSKSQFISYDKQLDKKIEKQNNINIYWKDEKLDFEYQKLGFAQIKLKNTTKENTLSYLKNLARQHGGDAVIFTELKTGRLKNNNLDADKAQKKRSLIYHGSRPQISGIVVKRIFKDTIYKSKIDTSFVEDVKRENVKLQIKVKNKINFLAFITGSVLFLLFLVFVYFIVKQD